MAHYTRSQAPRTQQPQNQGGQIVGTPPGHRSAGRGYVWQEEVNQPANNARNQRQANLNLLGHGNGGQQGDDEEEGDGRFSEWGGIGELGTQRNFYGSHSTPRSLRTGPLPPLLPSLFHRMNSPPGLRTFIELMFHDTSVH